VKVIKNFNVNLHLRMSFRPSASIICE